MSASVMDRVRRALRETGRVPAGAKVYVDGVEFTGTGDELLDALGYVDAHVRVSIMLPPTTEGLTVFLTAGGSVGSPPENDERPGP